MAGKDVARVLGSALLGGSGASGRAAFTSLSNQRSALRQRQEELDLKRREKMNADLQQAATLELQFVKEALSNPTIMGNENNKPLIDALYIKGTKALGVLGVEDGLQMLQAIPVKADEDATQLIQTTDAQGNPVQRFVSKSSTEDFAVQPPQREPKKTERVNALRNGKVVPALKTFEGHLLDPTTRERMPDATIAPTRMEQGVPGEFSSTGDVTAGDPVLRRKQVQQINDIKSNLAKAQNAFDSFKAAPGSGGFGGAIADKVGGIFGQIPGVGGSLEKSINLALTGGTAEENTRARTDAIKLASSMIQEVTGEESGRFTEAERELAFKAQRQLSPTSSIPQITEAYLTTIESFVNSRDRGLKELKLEPKFSTETPESREEYVKGLMTRGFTEKQAIDALRRRMRAEELGDV